MHINMRTHDFYQKRQLTQNKPIKETVVFGARLAWELDTTTSAPTSGILFHCGGSSSPKVSPDLP